MCYVIVRRSLRVIAIFLLQVFFTYWAILTRLNENLLKCIAEIFFYENGYADNLLYV